MQAPEATDEALARAHATIEQQSAEIARLH
jgi:hypothetical protein